MGGIGDQSVLSLNLSLDGLDRGVERVDEGADLRLDALALKPAERARRTRAHLVAQAQDWAQSLAQPDEHHEAGEQDDETSRQRPPCQRLSAKHLLAHAGLADDHNGEPVGAARDRLPGRHGPHGLPPEGAVEPDGVE